MRPTQSAHKNASIISPFGGSLSPALRWQSHRKHTIDKNAPTRKHQSTSPLPDNYGKKCLVLGHTLREALKLLNKMKAFYSVAKHRDLITQ